MSTSTIFKIVCPLASELVDVAFSPDDKSFATISTADHAVTLWNVSSLEQTELTPPAGGTFQWRAIDFSIDGRFLAAVDEVAAHIWSLRDASHVWTLAPPEGFLLCSVAFHQNRNLLAAGAVSDGLARVVAWGTEDGRMLWTSASLGSACPRVATAGDAIVASGESGGAGYLASLSASDGSQLRRTAPSLSSVLRWDVIVDVASVKRGRQAAEVAGGSGSKGGSAGATGLVAAAAESGAVAVVEALGLTLRETLPPTPRQRGNAGVSLSADGALMAVGTLGGTRENAVRLWDMERMAVVGVVPEVGRGRAGAPFALSGDGRMLAAWTGEGGEGRQGEDGADRGEREGKGGVGNGCSVRRVEM